MEISVCIATYRRTERLELLLRDLALQTCLPKEVVVVDNDASGSAKETVLAHAKSGVPYEVKYEIQPVKNIARTRNKTVELATREWLAFIDDDERAPPTWLAQLAESALQYAADGVLAPVTPKVPETAPQWIKSGQFYDFPRLPTGAVVPLNRLRFGNVILRGSTVKAEPGPFDVNYGLMTGEDADMLARLVKRGARIIWCDDAEVYEPVEPARLSLRWLLQRALSGGQEFARKAVKGIYGEMNPLQRLVFFGRCFAQLALAVVLAPLSLPIGKHHAANWLIKAAANAGKLSVLSGWRYREYA